MSKLTHAIAKASDAAFKKLTTNEPRHRSQRSREETISPEAARIRQRNAWRNLQPIVINTRYHVTFNPKFKTDESLTSDGDLERAMKWCEFKLNQVLNITGAPLIGLYIWDTEPRFPQLVARYLIVGDHFELETN